MTVLVGVQCTDGIVIGVDSMATSTAGPNPLVQILSNDKLQAVGDRILLATTGSVGLSQRFRDHVQRHWDGSKFRGQCSTCMAALAGETIRDFQASGVSRHPQMGLGFGALVAAVIEQKPYLVEFQVTDFQPEIKHGRLFSVSIGSGQILADPFLAFVSRVLWQNEMPDVYMAKMGIFWVLSHTIQYAPGGVGAPIKLGTLKKIGGNWNVSISEDTQEQAQFIQELEKRIHESPKAAIEDAQKTPLPEPPKAA